MSGSHATSRHPYQPTSNYPELSRKQEEKIEKKNQKKKIRKKSEKNLSRKKKKDRKKSKCHISNFF